MCAAARVSEVRRDILFFKLKFIVCKIEREKAKLEKILLLHFPLKAKTSSPPNTINLSFSQFIPLSKKVVLFKRLIAMVLVFDLEKF